MPALQTQANVSVGADVYSQPDRQRTYFRVSFQKANMVPIQVHINNRGDKPISVRPAEICLETSEGAWNSPLSSRAAAEKVLERAKGAGIALGAVLGGVIGLVTQAYAAEEAEKKLIEELQQKELKAATLGKGESVHGFLYYAFPGEIPPTSALTLVATVREADTQKPLTIRTPLR
jgi:hypothetical protein